MHISSNEEYSQLFVNAVSQTNLSVTTSTRLCVPRGGYGQHLRWLILLSEDYVDLETINCPNYFFPKVYYPLRSIDRVKFLLEYVYPLDRSYDNWTTAERLTNIKLHNYMGFCHDATQLESIDGKEYNTILGSTDVDTAIRHWYKLHPFWLGNLHKKSTRQDFINSNIEQNQKISDYKPTSKENIFRFNSTDLNSPVLNQNLYEDLTSFLNVKNVYYYANQLHERWYNIHKLAEQEIVNYFRNSKYPNFPWVQHKDDFSKVATPEDYENIRNTIMELYA